MHNLPVELDRLYEPAWPLFKLIWGWSVHILPKRNFPKVSPKNFTKKTSIILKTTNRLNYSSTNLVWGDSNYDHKKCSILPLWYCCKQINSIVIDEFHGNRLFFPENHSNQTDCHFLHIRKLYFRNIHSTIFVSSRNFTANWEIVDNFRTNCQNRDASNEFKSKHRFVYSGSVKDDGGNEDGWQRIFY